MIIAEAESEPVAKDLEASAVCPVEYRGRPVVAGAAAREAADCSILRGSDTICYAIAAAVLAASIWGGLDAVAVALCGHCIPWGLPAMLVASYLVVGLLAGAALGVVHALVQRLRVSPGDARIVRGNIRAACLSASIAVVVVVFIERLQLDPLHGFGGAPRMVSISGGAAVLLGGLVALRRLSVSCAAPWSYPWQVSCAVLFCLLWKPFNELYEASRLSLTSLVANGCYVLIAVALYLTGRTIIVRVPFRGDCDAPGRYLRWSAAACLIGLSVAGIAAWFVKPTPIDLPHLAVSNEFGGGAAAKPNVVLIVMDTVRADHLSTYGYRRDTTPHLTAFAGEAVLYSQAVAPSSWTLPSHASLFTGLMPTEHGAHYHTDPTTKRTYLGSLGENHTTLAEVLLANGYDTGAIIANTVPLRREHGLHQGFLYYDDRPWVSLQTAWPRTVSPAAWFVSVYQLFTGRVKIGFEYRDASEINTEVLSWLDGTSHPFFLFINYVDPHAPYRPHPEFDDRLDRVPVCDEITTADGQRKVPRVGVPPELCGELANYDAEIAHLDERINEIFDELKARELYDNSLIIVTSDHGEAFAEHGFTGHLNSLYEEEIRVPLMIRYPGGDIRGVETKVTSLTSVFRTVLRFLALPEMGPAKDLVSADASPVLAELHMAAQEVSHRKPLTLHALYSDDGMKAITTARAGEQDGSFSRKELYELTSDAGELTDLSTKYPVIMRQMSALTATWVRSAKARAPQPDGEAAMTADLREQLRSLGYLD